MNLVQNWQIETPKSQFCYLEVVGGIVTKLVLLLQGVVDKEPDKSRGRFVATFVMQVCYSTIQVCYSSQRVLSVQAYKFIQDLPSGFDINFRDVRLWGSRMLKLRPFKYLGSV